MNRRPCFRFFLVMVFCLTANRLLAQAEPPHPILTITGSGSGANVITNTWTDQQYTNNFVPRSSPRSAFFGFAPAVVSGDTGWSWSTNNPNAVISQPSGTVFPTTPGYVVKTQSVAVFTTTVSNNTTKTIQVPYYDKAGSTTVKSLVFALIDDYKRGQLRSDLNRLSQAYMASGASHATRDQNYARRIAMALKSWADYFPDYYLTDKNNPVFINVTANYQLPDDYHRASNGNGLSGEWYAEEIRAFDAIHDSPALTNLSVELGFDVRAYIRSNLFFNEGDFIVYHVPVGQAIASNLSNPYRTLALVARVLGRPDYMDYLDRYLFATVHDHIRRDGTLSEGIAYSQQYIEDNLDTARYARDYFLSRPADTPLLQAISNRVHEYVAVLEFGSNQWRQIAMPNGEFPSFGDTDFGASFPARNTGQSALVPAYGSLAIGAGSGGQSVQVNQNFSGDNNHMRSDTTALSLWAFGNEYLGNIRYHNTTPGRQFTEQILAHDAVTIDRSDMSSPSANTYGNGDLTLYEAGNNGLHVTEIDGQRAYNNKASRYQRIVLLNTRDLAKPYLVDVFRVTGGTNHDYVFHGTVRYDHTYQCSFPLVTNTMTYPMLEGSETWVEPTSSGSTFPYYGLWRNVSSNTAPGDFQITYRDVAANKRDLRLWMTDDGTARVYVGRTPVPSRTGSDPANFWVNNLWRHSTIIRKRVTSGPLQNLFVSVIEPMTNGVSAVQSVERLPVSGGSLDSVALRVTLTDGRVDTYLVNLRNPQVAGANTGSASVSTADGKYILSGRVGVHSEGSSGARVWTVNASDFQYDNRRLTTPGTYYSGWIGGETRKLTGGGNDAFFTSATLPMGTALRNQFLSVTYGALSGSGTTGINEMYKIDQVILTNGQYHICFTNDHLLEITSGTTSVEQRAALRTFTTSNSFEITLSASAVPISAIADLNIPVNGSSGPVNFTFGNLGSTAGSALSVFTASSNPALVPTNNIAIGGSGTNRTLTITPAPGAKGPALITVSVTDGSWVSSRSFNVLVGDFVLTATPASQTVAAPGVASYTATLTATNGFTNIVMLGVTGVPSDVSAGFSPPTLNGGGSSALNVTVSNTAAPGNYTLTLTAESGSLASTTTVALVIGGPANLRWASTSNPAWDTNAFNWLNLATSIAAAFKPGDQVLFDDTAGVVTNVTIASGVSVAPETMQVATDTNSFTFSGSGKISGAATLVKKGRATLALNTANDFTGTVTINDGVVVAGTTTALGSTTAGTIVANSGSLDVNGLNLTAEPVTLSGEGLDAQGAVINRGAVQTSALRQVVLAGDVTLGGTNRWDIRNTGGTASLSTSPAGSSYKITKVGPNQVSLVGVTVLDSALGDIEVQEGTLAIQTTTIQVGNPASNITVFGGATLNVYRLTNAPLNKELVFKDGATFYSENDRNTVLGSILLESGAATFNVNSNGGVPALILNNIISGAGGLIKTGAAPLILPASNTYSGPTLLNSGTLVLTNSGSIGASASITLAGNATLDVRGRVDGKLTLNRGQTLNGNGAIAGSLTVNSNATVSPGTSIGALTVTNIVTLHGVTFMELDKGNSTNDVIRGALAIHYGGTLQLTNLSGVLNAGDSFKLFYATNCLGTFTNILPAIPRAGLVWDTSGLPNGVLSIGSGATTPPRIGIMADLENVIMSGTSSLAGVTYYVLTSTNLSLPLEDWTRVATNTFEGSGNLNFTNAMEPGPARYYLIQVP